MSSDLTLRHMQVADVAQVVRIDELSFTAPWPDRSYRFEINESNVSYMVVLEQPNQRSTTGLRRWWNTLLGNHTAESSDVIVGYGGLWKIAEEAHISTIATHPDYRGHKFGEIILAGMLRRAIALNAAYVVLEVRVSNDIAKNLYHKYGFEIHGVKKNYYHHDNEDAYDMRLELTREAIDKFSHQYNALQQRIQFKDQYSRTPHPRLGR
jgi:[ribosomal protein S18]-alanine N-acetyltransferase